MSNLFNTIDIELFETEPEATISLMETKTMKQLIQELGIKIATSTSKAFFGYPFYDYFGIVFLLCIKNDAAIVYGNTKDFINNVKQGKIKFVRLL